MRSGQAMAGRSATTAGHLLYALCLSVVVIWGSLAEGSGDCNYTYSTIYNGYCYFGVTQLLNWAEAKANCRQENASLADIQSDSENAIATNVFPLSLTREWIGLNDIANEGTFVWDLQNSSVASNYTNWARGEPNDQGGIENCVEIIITNITNIKRGKWNDKDCTARMPSLCKKGTTAVRPTTVPLTTVPPTTFPLTIRPTTVPPTTDLPGPASCNYTYSMIYNGYCYFGVTQLFTWAEAKANCGQEKANLADIQSDSENAIALNVLPSSFTREWIGLNGNAKNGKYMWAFQNSSMASNYTNWAVGEPNNQGDVEQCVEMILTYSDSIKRGKWNDKDCSSRMTSLCKKAISQCPVLSTPVNGFMMGSGLTYGSNRTFRCQNDYFLQGSAFRTCQMDGTWSGKKTSCSSGLGTGNSGARGTAVSRILPAVFILVPLAILSLL